MLIFKALFWTILGLLLFVYFGYSLVLYLYSLIQQEEIYKDKKYRPTVSLIIAAYNEEEVIKDKIENSLKLDYPKDKLEIIIFSDASSDQTDDIVRTYEDQGVKLLRIEGRKGKTYCQNETVDRASGEIVVFSDANSMYQPEAIQKLVQNFADDKVGCVSGVLRYKANENEVKGESIYWKYEQIIKQLESKVSSLVGVNGAIYAVREELYAPLRADIISDFIEPMRIVQKGYKVVYEPQAGAYERTAADPGKESDRRVRIVNRAAHSLFHDSNSLHLLNIFTYNIFSLQLWFHKIFRWFSGVYLLAIFVSNIFLFDAGFVYRVALFSQIGFYLLALWGFTKEQLLSKKTNMISHVFWFFLLSCYGMLKGVLLAFLGEEIVVWETK